MTKVLLISFGSRGDVQPYIALGKALAQRGAAVTLSTSKSFNDAISLHGLKAAPNSIDVEAMMQSPDMEAALRTFRGKLAAMRIGKEMVSRQLDETWQIVQDLRPDIIVYHPKAATATYFARALGVVAIPSFLQPGIIPTKHLPPVLLPFPDLGPVGNRVSNAFFHQLFQFGGRSLIKPWMKSHPALFAGEAISPLDGYSPQNKEVPRLHAFSHNLVPKPEDWPNRDFVTGPWFLDEQTTQPDAADVPEDIHIIKSAPHDWLFQRCAAIVHHGGAGTVHQGLRCGKPMLICPVFADQPFWGKQVAALGVGPKPIKLNKLTTPKLASALLELQQPKYHTAAENLGKAIRDEQGAAQAAELLLALT